MGQWGQMGRAGQIISPLEINKLQIELAARFQEGDGKPTMKILDGATGNRIDETEATTPWPSLPREGSTPNPFMRADRGQEWVAVWRQLGASTGGRQRAGRPPGRLVSAEFIVESTS